MNALLSVYNKDGLIPFAEQLVELGYTLFSSGGTAKKIADAGLAVNEVGINILDHRVATLVPEVHAGLLAKPGIHDEEMTRRGFKYFDVVCVDLYPMKDVIESGGDEASVIEKTDIGGPTMIRAAAKGRRLVICHPEQRQPLVNWLRAGRPNEEIMRQTLAMKAEKTVSMYVEESAQYLRKLIGPKWGGVESVSAALRDAA
jgi:phosphoribosylaminoimidazolecarboxamide formyltransferase/IMP cyclohydrolase